MDRVDSVKRKQKEESWGLKMLILRDVDVQKRGGKVRQTGRPEEPQAAVAVETVCLAQTQVAGSGTASHPPPESNEHLCRGHIYKAPAE